MRILMRRGPFVSAAVLATAFCATSSAQSRYATQIVSFSQGGGGGIFVTANLLGGPEGGGPGAGSLDVLTLGEGGNVVLGFDVDITDGPGADFSVFENGFLIGSSKNVFAEVAFVEVSTNGVDFARYPTRYAPPSAGGTPIGTFGGMSGGAPVLANVNVDPTAPFDPVRSGGEAFDLADLAGHPSVVAGLVDLSLIRYVRLVDVLANELDSLGTPIPAAGGADFDAVAVLNDTLEPTGGPICDLSVDGAGFLELRLGDPDGFFDLNLSTLSNAWSLTPLPLDVLLQLFTITSFDGNVLVLRSVAPVTGVPLRAVLAVSVQDFAGQIAGDHAYIQG